MGAEFGKNVDVEYKDGVARLTLARADKLNPLDWATVRELKAAVTEIDARPDAVSPRAATSTDT
jgi:enoyl-CoA hydratase/carnithine racemase